MRQCFVAFYLIASRSAGYADLGAGGANFGAGCGAPRRAAASGLADVRTILKLVDELGIAAASPLVNAIVYGFEAGGHTLAAVIHTSLRGWVAFALHRSLLSLRLPYLPACRRSLAGVGPMVKITLVMA
jgi:hypothetical protein